MDPVQFVLGVFLFGVATNIFLTREVVASRLARSYAARKAWPWEKGILGKRFGIRETRLIALLGSIAMAGVGVWFAASAF